MSHLSFSRRHSRSRHVNATESESAGPGALEAANVDTGATLDRLAGAIERAGMTTPATFALHIARPLSWMGGQALWVLQPFLSLFARPSSLPATLASPSIVRLFEGEEGVQQLMERLERGSPDPQITEP